MANPQIQIGNLEFDDIKNSIKQYLQTQDVFSDYNFEGSAASTLLDILAYNTKFWVGIIDLLEEMNPEVRSPSIL